MAGSNPGDDNNPDNIIEDDEDDTTEEVVNICKDHPAEKDVSLILECSDGTDGCKKGSSKIATISNTIKTANLPVYTVCRKEAKDTSLDVILRWTVSGDHGSTSELITYKKIPRIVPYINRYKSNLIPSGRQGYCEYNSLPAGISADFFSFKFIDANKEAIENTEMTSSGMTVNEIKVTIPAGSQGTIFQLDPHRCPDATSPVADRGDRVISMEKNKNTVNIGIININEESLPLAIEYPHDKTTDIQTLKNAMPLLIDSVGIESALRIIFEKYFLYDCPGGMVSGGACTTSPTGSKKLYDASSTDADVISAYNSALKEADKKAGEFGSDE